MLGEHINIGKNVMDLLPKIGMGKVSDWLMKVGGQNWYRTTREWLNRGGVSGYGGEVIEEEIGIPLNAIFVGDEEISKLLDARTQRDILGGMALSMAAMNAGSLAMYGAQRGALELMHKNDERKLDKADEAASSIFGEKAWTELKKEIDETENNKFADKIGEIAGRNFTKEENKAVSDYMSRLLVMRGHNLGENAALMAQAQDSQPKRLSGTEAEEAMREIFERGTMEVLPEEVKDYEKEFSNPIRTVLGEVVKIGKSVFDKLVRRERSNISGAIRPTLENADFVLNDVDGSRIYVKMFNKPDGSKTINVAVVNKTGELEDYISSVHIKSVNNLLNKIKNGAELSLPSKRTSYGDETPNSAATFSVGEGTENSATVQANGGKNPFLHEDGTLHKATLYPSAENGGQPQEVFVTKGDIVTREDGTVDADASSDVVYYKDADGNTHMASPKMFQGAETPVSAEDNRTNRTDRTNTTDTTAAPRFFMDDEVKVTDAVGNTYDGVVSGTFKTEGKNEITVDYEDADGNMRRVKLPADELARMNGYAVDRTDETNRTDRTNTTDTVGAENATTNRNAERQTRGEVQPVGRGIFGNIYDQFKGNVKEAINFGLLVIW